MLSWFNVAVELAFLKNAVHGGVRGDSFSVLICNFTVLSLEGLRPPFAFVFGCRRLAVLCYTKLGKDVRENLGTRDHFI